MKEALFYTREGHDIRCCLCPHQCLIKEGKTGLCQQRKNIGGKLMASGYAKVSAFGMDPIEKKPLYHFYPGSSILSVGGLWCNLKCLFCQNWHIAHQEQRTVEVAPEQLVQYALHEKSIGIAFTYNEPTIWYEYVMDTAYLARQNGLKIVLVTNGFIQLEPLKKLLPYVDAMNIDVKSFNDDYYRNICGGRLESVKNVVENAFDECHIEITTLIVEGHNDELDENRQLFKWLAGLRKSIPLHLSRYYPSYKMEYPPTSIETLETLRQEAKRFLNYVYVGNVLKADANTYCPQCGLEWISRESAIKVAGVSNNRCIQCGRAAEIVM